MREVKKLDKTQLRDALSIAAKAYPMMNVSTEQQFEDFEKRIMEEFNTGTRVWYGLFDDGMLLGNMVIYDFQTNYYGMELPARGIGFVATDFLHKKQKVAKEMLHWYLEDSLAKKFPVAILYSFRPDFYKKMGFGYGTTCYNYVTSPDCLPLTDTHYQMDYMNLDDKDDIFAFYRTLYHNQHGMIPRKISDIEGILKAQGVYKVGYREDGKLAALLIFRMTANESTNMTTHMSVDLMFTSPTGLQAAFNFLHSQADQVTEIAFSTPHRDFFYNLSDIRHNDHRVLKDPGFHHVFDTGMGMMYRSLNPVQLVIDRPSILDNIRIRFLLTDSFMEDTRRDFIIEWKDDKAKLSKSKKFDVELKFDVSDFSSWIFNAIDLTTLYQYGLVQISDKSFLPTLEHAFYYQQKPVCLERF